MIGPEPLAALCRGNSAWLACQDEAYSIDRNLAHRDGVGCSWSRSKHRLQPDNFPARSFGLRGTSAKSRRFRIVAPEFARSIGLGIQAIDPLNNPFFTSGGHRRHGVLLVAYRNVVDPFFPFLVEPTHPIQYDDGGLVVVGWIVGSNRWEGYGVQVAMAILVLQTFTIQGGPTGRSTDQEALGSHIGGGPNDPNALESEHRVIDIETESC